MALTKGARGRRRPVAVGGAVAQADAEPPEAEAVEMVKGEEVQPGGADAGARPEVVGFLEECLTDEGRRLVKGWAFDRGRPERRVRLVAYIDGSPVSEFECGLERADLVANGLWRGDCGFLWPVPEECLDGKAHRLTFRTEADTALEALAGMAMDWRPLAAGTEVVEADAGGGEPSPAPAAADPAGAGRADTVLAEARQLFDAAFYLEAYPGAVAADEDAWAHFLRIGAREGRNPNLLFDVAHYNRANPDVAALGLNPLLHYVDMGRAEGRRFHWLFNTADYLRLNPDLVQEPNLLLHMLTFGLGENRQPHVLFQPWYYFKTYPDVAASGQSAFRHFLWSGDREGRAPNPMFDPGHYRLQCGLGLRAEPGAAGALQHYLESGGQHDPHPLFDTAFYRSGGAGWSARESPLQHYIDAGGPDGFDPHPLFDTATYLRQCHEPTGRSCPLQHYLTEGRQRGLSPNSLFDPGFYAGQPLLRSWDGTALPRTGPRISVVVPVYNTPPGVLRECIESVLSQTYANWELSIVDDGSRDPGTAAMLARYRGVDPRIRIDRSTANLHIALATNRAVMQATGEFVAFLDHDDVLEREALAEVAAAVAADPTIDMLYTDEDKLDEHGVRRDTYHKPGWSPEHLESVMYVLHMLTVRKSVFWAVGGSRPERTGAQDYDLVLRVARQARTVHHIPRILYHWRMLSGSAAGELEAKPYALLAAKSALEDAVRDEDGAVVAEGLLQGTFRVRRSLAGTPEVTLLVFTNDSEREVPGRGRINLVRNFIESIMEKSSYGNAKLLVVDNGNSSAETKKLVARAGGTITQYKMPGAFSYAKKANFALKAVRTEHLIYLNDDLEVISPDWIEALLEQSTREEVGGVGARLLFPDGGIQHSGVVLGVHGATAHAFHNLGRETVGYNAYTHVVRNYSAVTGAVFATRRSIVAEVGGYDERLAVDYNDVDLCLRIGQTGRRIVFTPFSELYHFEGSTAVRTAQDPQERALFLERWSGLIARDPFYNPNLPRDRTGFA